MDISLSFTKLYGLFRIVPPMQAQSEHFCKYILTEITMNFREHFTGEYSLFAWLWLIPSNITTNVSMNYADFAAVAPGVESRKTRGKNPFRVQPRRMTYFSLVILTLKMTFPASILRQCARSAISR